MEHLAIMDKQTINMILNGEKIIETRFSKNKISPYQKLSVGDKIYLKESGKEIIAVFEIDKFIYFKGLNGDKIENIKDKYNSLIKAPNEYWKLKSSSNYGTLIYIKNPHKLDKTIKINKKGRQGFVSCEEHLKYKSL